MKMQDFIFQSISYTRPDHLLFEEELRRYISTFNKSSTFDKQVKIILKIKKLRIEFETPLEIAWVRYSMNTNDVFYKREKEFIDNFLPEYDNLMNEFFNALLKSPFRKELISRFGERIFIIAETSINRISPQISREQQEENKLKSRYNQVLASCSVLFRGKKRNFSELSSFESSNNRQTRQRASELKFGFLAKNQDTLDSIFDEMVQLRHIMSQKMGLNNYVELGYLYRNRSDYTPKDVEKLREEVLNHITPLVTKLMEDQSKRLNIDSLYYYDESCRFPNGNAKLIGDSNEIFKNLQTMFSELSSDTDEFFKNMIKHKMMDIENRDGKEVGAYCSCIPEYDSPFIFTNFNGTDDDIRVFIHEAGHAFQIYSAGRQEFIEYIWPTFDAGEIPSMAMEFFTWSWMELFFGRDADKYRYAHFVKSLVFLPYGCAIDEFQHRVYENPTLTSKERHYVWREIEKKYLPFRDYDRFPYLEMGGYWQKQWHIYKPLFIILIML